MALLILSFILGAGVGSFVNVLAARTVAGKSIFLPRSFCDACARPLWRRDMIPVLSFFLLHARCRFCHAKFSWQYPIVELATGLLFALAAWLPPQFHGLVHETGVTIVHAWIAVTALVALFLTDLRAMVLPDRITLPAIATLLIIDLLFLKMDVRALGLAALLGGGFFLIQYLISRGRWVGSGDIRMGVLIAMILGSWQIVGLALMLSYILGALVSLPLLVTKKKHLQSKVPLGVFLAIGTLVTLFGGSWFLAKNLL